MKYIPEVLTAPDVPKKKKKEKQYLQCDKSCSP